MDPLIALRRAFSLEPEGRRIYVGESRPKGCSGFLPHANSERNPLCVRCGKPRELHKDRLTGKA